MKKQALKTAITAFLSLSLLLSAYSCLEESPESDKSNDISDQTDISDIEEPKTEDNSDSGKYVTEIETKTEDKTDSRKYVKEKYQLPRDTGCLYQVEKSSGKLYFTGIEGNGYVYHLDTGSKKIETDCYDMIDPLMIYRTLTSDNKHYVVYYGHESKSILCSIDTADHNIINKTELTGMGSAEAMYLDEDRNVCILSVNHQKEAEINVYSPDLDLLNTTSITENLQLSDNEIITEVLYDGNGSYYFVTYESEDGIHGNGNPALLKLNSSYELQYRSDMSMLEKFTSNHKFIAKSSNFFIAAYNRESGSIKFIEISSNTGEKINEYEIPWGTGENYPYITSDNEDSEYDFIYQTPEGVYGYTLTDNISTEIIRFSDYPEINFASHGCICTGKNECVMDKGPVSNKFSICVYNENDNHKRSRCTIQLGESLNTSAVSDDGFIYSYTFDQIINKINDTGKIINSFDCTELISENQYVQNLLIGPDNKIYIEIIDNNDNSDNSDEIDKKRILLILNDDGTKYAEIQLEDYVTICDIACADKSDYLIYRSDDKLKIAGIDHKNNKLDENTGFKNIDLHNAVPYPEKLPMGSPEYDFYYQTDTGLFGCLLKEDKTDKLLDFAEHKLNSKDIKVYWIDENEIIYNLYIEDGNENGYYHLKRVE